MMYGCGGVLFIVASIILLPSVSAYPVRNGRIRVMTSSSGTCASIGYTTGCCPPDEDCQVTVSAGVHCYCSSDCHMYGDCCTDITSVCPSNPSTCAELGFIDRCCDDVLSMGMCFVESNGVMCSCKSSCFMENNCCPDIGCQPTVTTKQPTTCTGAGLDPGCCEGNCTVRYDDEACYCDEMCRQQGDCCTDVDLTSQCETPTCTPTIRTGNRNSKMQQIRPRPRLQPLELLKRYQNRMNTYASTSRAQMLPAARGAYVSQQGMVRDRLSKMMESRASHTQARRKTRN